MEVPPFPKRYKNRSYFPILKKKIVFSSGNLKKRFTFTNISRKRVNEK